MSTTLVSNCTRTRARAAEAGGTAENWRAGPVIDATPRGVSGHAPNASPGNTTVDRSTAGAPLGGWRRLGSDSWLVAWSGLVSDALGAVTSLWLRVCLDPAQMGVWQGLKLLLSYANYSNLGISKGAVRDWNVAQGSGDLSAARRGLDLGHTVNTLGSLVYAGLLLGIAGGLWLEFGAVTSGDSGKLGWLAVWQALVGQPWCLGLAAVGLLAWWQRELTYRVTILRAERQFGITSRLTLAEALGTLVCAGLGAWWGGLAGLYLGTGLVMAATLVGLRSATRLEFAWAWNRAEVTRLIAAGSPMLLAGLVASLFRSLDKLVILHGLADREVQLGTYSLALLASGQLFGLGNAVSLAVAPRYAELWGHSRSRRATAQLAARASEPVAALASCLGAAAVLTAPPLLGAILPNYSAGLAALVALVPGTVALVLAIPAQQWMLAVGDERRALWFQAGLLAAAVALQASVVHSGGGITAIAAATSISYLALWLVLVAGSLWPEWSPGERRRYLAAHALAGAPLLTALVWVIWWQAPQAPTAGAAGGALVSVAGVAALVLVSGWRWGGWAEAWRREAHA